MSTNTTITWHGQRKGREKPETFLSRASGWLASTCARTLVADPATVLDEAEGPVLYAGLHPAAPLLELRCLNGKQVVAIARTSGVGPGYHRHIESLLGLLGAAVGITWDEGAKPTSRKKLEQSALAWLSAVAEQCLAAFEAGSERLAISMPTEPVFAHDGDVTTWLGPRDKKWLARVAKDPAEGIDIFPWWPDGTGAPQSLSRALCLLWTEVRFRQPIDEDEHQTLVQVAQLLAAAYDDDPELDYPFAEWGEVLDLLGEQGELRDLVEKQARKKRSKRAPIGYRRDDVVLTPFPGWTLRIPGSLAILYEDEGSTFCAFEPGRAVRFSSYAVSPGSKSVDELLAVGLEDDEDEAPKKTKTKAKTKAKKAPKRPSHIDLDADGVRGWAKVHTLDEGGRMVEGHSAVEGRLCIATIAFEDPELEPWALEIWKGIRPT